MCLNKNNPPDKLNAMALGNQVKKYRSMLGWTLEELETASGVATGTIHALEARDSLMSKYAQALACALGLTLDQLLDEATTHTPRPPRPPTTPAKPATPTAGETVRNYDPAELRIVPSLSTTLSHLATHMQRLDSPMRNAAAALISHLCANPEDPQLQINRLMAMTAIPGNVEAQKSTTSQTA